MIDFSELAAKLSVWAHKANVIEAAALRIKNTYDKLEPTTKASVIADLKTLSAQVQAIAAALEVLESDDDMQKLGAGIQLARTAGQAASVAGRIFTDVKTVAVADWSVLQPDVMIIVNTLEDKNVGI